MSKREKLAFIQTYLEVLKVNAHETHKQSLSMCVYKLVMFPIIEKKGNCVLIRDIKSLNAQGKGHIKGTALLLLFFILK